MVAVERISWIPCKPPPTIMATAVVGSSPADETKFWMSFQDANAGFMEGGFETGTGPASRGACWLGRACP